MAGARSKRRGRFFSDHPFCCFCGGATPATTEDHIPGRGLFLNRQWPQGYVFPACEPCNNSSSTDELMLAWMTRLPLRDFSAGEEADFERASLALRARLPKIWDGLRLFSRNETRQVLRESKLPSSVPGVTDIVEAFEMPQEMHDGAVRYAEKLGKALHYHHTQKIVPESAFIRARVFPEITLMSPDFPMQIFAVITGEPVIKRASTHLQGQFDYRYVTVEDGAASGFFVSFGDGMAMIVAIFCDSARYETTKRLRDLLGPSAKASPAPSSAP